MLFFIVLLIAIVFFYAGYTFYRFMDWQEEAEPSPDLRQMHKKQAELQHIQELLEEAKAEGKLSQKVIDEFSRYSDQEIENMDNIEKAWLNRKSKPKS